MSCELCTIGFEPRKWIIMADFIRLIAAIGGLKAMVHNNQAKIGAEIKTIQEMKAQVGVPLHPRSLPTKKR
jgi:hypothetical protein